MDKHLVDQNQVDIIGNLECIWLALNGDATGLRDTEKI